VYSPLCGGNMSFELRVHEKFGVRYADHAA
jgi:hypothetical protein